MELSPVSFEIDELRLEQEWLEHPGKHYLYGEHLAECHKAHDEAKNEFELVKSQCDQMLRKNPAKHGLNKTTEQAIGMHIPTMAVYQEAQQKVVDARYELEKAKAALSASEARKRALEKVVELFLSNYFSEPQRREANPSEEEAANKRAARKSRRRKR